MSVYEQLINFEKEFSLLQHTPIFINDLETGTNADNEKIRIIISTLYEGDLMRNVASCECGNPDLLGDFNIGVVCPLCNTPVLSSSDMKLESKLWIKTPQGIPGFINLSILSMLSDAFTVSGFNIIQYIADPSYKPLVKEPPILNSIKENFTRGYNNFILNFDDIMERLFHLKKFPKKQGHFLLYELIKNNRNKLITQYLPLPNKAMFVVEKTNVGNYVDPSTLMALDAIRTFVGIDNQSNRFSQRIKENRTVKTLFGLADYYYDFFKESFGKKPGIARQHLFGSRSFFSFRTVVTSITEPHEIDEIHIPWSVGIAIFRYHIANKLFKRKFLLDDILSLLNNYAKKFHPLIDKIFKELIDESPEKGVVCTINRNPSMMNGSIERMRITIVKQPGSQTTSFPITIVTPLNADYLF